MCRSGEWFGGVASEAYSAECRGGVAAAWCASVGVRSGHIAADDAEVVSSASVSVNQCLALAAVLCRSRALCTVTGCGCCVPAQQCAVCCVEIPSVVV